MKTYLENQQTLRQNSQFTWLRQQRLSDIDTLDKSMMILVEAL